MKNLLIKTIDIYQKISRHYPKNCRFSPTCSEYTKQAIEKYGPLYGIIVGTKRIIRCNQFFKGGHDPLPCNH
ncbi:membrane protein insertion efficiency factor YidD [Candidatus Saganbacteria bacterium]|nr:membrane protein insertion efficiency factor YidD [Candidatus Saganbacteria bacterium]